MSLDVTRKTISAVLEALQKGMWKIPAFQRDFVWKQNQVYALIDSIFRSRPIGLLTLWEQPQGNPHTQSLKVRLRTKEFGTFEKDPAQLALVLDGRQRLTSLAIVFGGLRETDGKMLFSGHWFLDLNKDPDTEDIVVYKKRSEYAREKLETLSECVNVGLLPLDRYSEFQQYLGGIFDSTRYPNNTLPDRATLEARQHRLAGYSQLFLEFQIPVAELPSSVTLPQVCDIFDVLNQTGTRVSTFDLMHNTIFADTQGQFELRKKLAQWSTDLPNFGLLCSDSRPDYLCQVVTGCYLSERTQVGRRSAQLVSSVKGGDLLATPTPFYERFAQNVGAIDTYCSVLFSADVLGGKASLAEIPYPTSAILFLSLNWAREFTLEEEDKFSPARLARLFRAFFWGNAFTGRYDQGFLTQFAKDRKLLLEILIAGGAQSEDTWPAFADAKLSDVIFGTQNRRKSATDLAEMLLDGNSRGAVSDAIYLFLMCSISNDITDGSRLDRFSTDQAKRVDLHHIYPQDWCKNNSAHHQIFADPETASVNCYANLTPLRAEVNREWKTREPKTAFAYFNLDTADPEVAQRLKRAFFSSEALSAIASVDPAAFLNARATNIAKELEKLQFVGSPA